MQNASVSKSIKTRLTTLAAIGILYPAAGLGAALCATSMFSGTAYAAPAAIEAVAQTPAKAADFQKKTYSLKGSVSIEQRGDQTVLVFSEDFKTRTGPDLKVFLSKRSVKDATGTNATLQSIRLGELTSNKGAQEYILPAGVQISDYASVLVHCEAFSKLWGGADLS